jgi:hypothetical protein
MRNISLPTAFADFISLSINLNNQGGTVSVSTLTRPSLDVNDEVTIQGLDCTVERIGPSLSSKELSFKTECRIGVIPNRFVSVVYENISGRDSYSLAAIAQDIASQAGVVLANAGVDSEVTQYSASSDFISAASSIADQMCGILTYQNGAWAIVRKTSSLGDFTIPIDDVISISQHAAGDAIDDVHDKVGSLKDTLIEADDLARELDDLEEQLRKAQEELDKAINELGANDSEEETGATGDITEDEEDPNAVVSAKANPLGRVNVSFGVEPGSSFRGVDDGLVIEGFPPEESRQDVWTPVADTGDLNPNNTTKQYFRIDDVVDQWGYPTGDKKGWYSIYLAKILVPMDEPSNASGIYWMRGTVNNFNVWADPNYWTLCFPVFREVEWTDEAGIKYSDRQMYIELPVWPSTIKDFGDHLAGECELHYNAQLEIVYMPTVTNPWDFVGTINYRLWPVVSGTTYLGMVDIDGNFYNLDGSSVASDITDVADLPGTIANDNVILDGDGAFVGIFAAGGASTLTGDFFAFLDSGGRVLRKGGSTTSSPIVGWISDAHTDLAWPGLGGPIPTSHENIEEITIGLEAEVISLEALNYTNYDPHRDPYGDDPDFSVTTDTDGDGIPDINDPDSDGDGIVDADQENIDSLRDQIDDLEDAIFENSIAAAAAEVRLGCIEAQLSEYGINLSIINTIKNVAKAWADYKKEKDDQDKADVENITLLKSLMLSIQTAEADLAAAISAIQLTATKTDCTFVYNNILPLVRNSITVPLISATNHTDSSTIDGITDTDGGIAESVSLSLTKNSAEVTVSTIKYSEG